MQTGKLRFADAFQSANRSEQAEMSIRFETGAKKLVRVYEWRRGVHLDDYRVYCHTAFAELMSPDKSSLFAITGPESLVRLMAKHVSFVIMRDFNESRRCAAIDHRLRREIAARSLHVGRGPESVWTPIVHQERDPEQILMAVEEQAHREAVVRAGYLLLHDWLLTRRADFRDNVRLILDYVIENADKCIRFTPHGMVFEERAIASGLGISIDQYRGRVKRLRQELQRAGFAPLSEMLTSEDVQPDDQINVQSVKGTQR